MRREDAVLRDVVIGRSAVEMMPLRKVPGQHVLRYCVRRKVRILLRTPSEISAAGSQRSPGKGTCSGNKVRTCTRVPHPPFPALEIKRARTFIPLINGNFPRKSCPPRRIIAGLRIKLSYRDTMMALNHMQMAARAPFVLRAFAISWLCMA